MHTTPHQNTTKTPKEKWRQTRHRDGYNNTLNKEKGTRTRERDREREQDRELSKTKDKTTSPSHRKHKERRRRRRKPLRDANSLVGTLSRSETIPDIGLKIANLVGPTVGPPGL
jgi:hypothetical protein